MTTANKITITRIMLIPVFVMMALYYGHSVQHGAPQVWQRWTAIAIFVLAAASDGIDGYIARRFNQKSRLGVVLDPLADKGLLLSAIITLSFSNWGYEFPVWFPVLIVARDVVILSGTLTLHFLNGSVRVRPSWTGKTATVLQMVAIALCMLQWNWFKKTLAIGSWRLEFGTLDLAVWLAGFLTLVSGFGYVVGGIAQLHDKGHGDPKSWNEI
ncbi:MAG: CDP-diacylglycerol--glycerol-3-phosphate 3-phosphatidyltransferase [Chthoniobacter sp.]|nr:CDP-diacylglycerol--glycerol-3-phosphate 3-phosphatidyltransferase [Chthoniobacter sp.]